VPRKEWPPRRGPLAVFLDAAHGRRAPADRTKLWHPLGAPDAFPPHAGGFLGSKRVLGFMSGPSANPNSVAEILLARPSKKPFWHPTGAMPIPHTATLTLPMEPPAAAVHTRTVRGRPRAAGAERFLDTHLSVSQAFLPSHTPNFAQISPKRAPKSSHRGSGGPPSPNGAHRHPPGPPRPRRGLGGAAGL
jgi:hypothetical protein